MNSLINLGYFHVLWTFVFGGLSCPRNSDYTYTFHIGENYGPYEYRDEDGYAKGFNIDLVNAVCTQAGKQCQTVMDRHSNCWETEGGHEWPGEGLLAGWYDGCMGVHPSPERYNAFTFTQSYSENYRAGLYYRRGAGFLEAQPNNLTGHKIGFIGGWAVSQHCLGRQPGFTGNRPAEYEAVMYDSHEDMIADVMLHKISGVLTAEGFDVQRLGLVHAEPMFYCTTGGAALMVRRGDAELLSWWDAAFGEMSRSGRLREVCEEAQRSHGHRGKIKCAYDTFQTAGSTTLTAYSVLTSVVPAVIIILHIMIYVKL